jgi:hypothetical protein
MRGFFDNLSPENAILKRDLTRSERRGILSSRVNFTWLRIVPYEQRKKFPRVFTCGTSKHFVIAHRSHTAMAMI